MQNSVKVLLLLGTLATEPLMAQDFDRGYRAYRLGNYPTALREWRPLADAGDRVAQYNLGVMYHLAQGVAQDKVRAFHWYALSAENGYAPAQFQVAEAYFHGQGTPLDFDRGRHWYYEAALRGYAPAQVEVGYFYQTGKGFPDDPRLAAEWFRKAAEQGDARGQRYLAILYETGRGVPPDRVLALMWMQLAADEGNKVAADSLDSIRVWMTREEIEEANRLAIACFEAEFKECGRRQ